MHGRAEAVARSLLADNLGTQSVLPNELSRRKKQSSLSKVILEIVPSTTFHKHVDHFNVFRDPLPNHQSHM